MKIFIGHNYSCGLNYQYQKILHGLLNACEITSEPREADVIVFAGTCSCTEYNIGCTIGYMESIIKVKKANAKVYLTGCMAREFNDGEYFDGVRTWIEQNIDEVIPQNQPNLLLRKILKEEYKGLNCDIFGAVVVEKEMSFARMYISNGCLHKCAFCKTTFQKYPLKSIDIEIAKELIDKIEELHIPELRLIGTNICQFGIDTHGRYLLPELLHYIESKKHIKDIYMSGFAFSDAIKQGFHEVIATSSKDYRLGGALESGSDRILDLMRKGFTSQEIINFVSTIRQRKEVALDLNIISGFPTETLTDVEATLDVLEVLNPAHVDVCRYINSPFVDSGKYEQLSPTEIEAHTEIYSSVLRKRKVPFTVKGSGYRLNN